VANKYKAVAITTPYWRPGEDYFKEILNSIENKIEDGDFVTISEKAISTATDNILDESLVNPSCLARFLAKNWMRFVWPKILGPLCHLRKRTIRRLRAYPIREGSAHKQVALERADFLQALMHGSEGAIDASNLPYSYVSLPLNNAQQTAEKIQGIIKSKLGKKVIVVIVDTDKTYSLKTFHFTPRPRPLRNIHTSGGLIAYLLGRFLKLKQRATPTAVAGSRIGIEEALEVADIANRSRGYGAGRTVWDMAKTFRVPLTGVTWDMLDKVKHQPIVIVKPRNK
jgi:F420-0:gamma-glutamyl ligase-like protein